MILRNITLEEFKVGFDDTFNVESNDWIPRLNKWILQGINMISSNVLYNPVAVDIEYKDSMMHIPFDIKILQGIAYKGIRLVPVDYSPLLKFNPAIPGTDPVNPTPEVPDKYFFLGNAGDNPLDFIVDPSDKYIEVMPEVKGHPGDPGSPGSPGTEASYSTLGTVELNMYTYAVLRTDIIKLNLPEPDGKVTIFYKSLPYSINDDGSIKMLIPDNEFLIEALQWYVLTRLIGRGYKHHTFDYRAAKQEWEDGRRRARRSVGSMSADQREKASQVFRNFLVDVHKWYKIT